MRPIRFTLPEALKLIDGGMPAVVAAAKDSVLHPVRKDKNSPVYLPVAEVGALIEEQLRLGRLPTMELAQAQQMLGITTVDGVARLQQSYLLPTATNAAGDVTEVAEGLANFWRRELKYDPHGVRAMQFTATRDGTKTPAWARPAAEVPVAQPATGLEFDEPAGAPARRPTK